MLEDDMHARKQLGLRLRQDSFSTACARMCGECVWLLRVCVCVVYAAVVGAGCYGVYVAVTVFDYRTELGE